MRLRHQLKMVSRRKLRLPTLNQTPTMSSKCSPTSNFSECLDPQDLEDHFTVIKELGSGTYGRVVLAQCHRTRVDVALKILPRTVKLRDVAREFNYSYYLSPHPHIINTFDVSFATSTSYVFAQEHAPRGDLFEAITPRAGLQERQAKSIALQISSALEFMHSRCLVHRDVKPENVLVFDDDLNRVKLMDFGMTKRVDTIVRKVSRGIPYTPPEICRAQRGDQYAVETGADVWAFGVLLFCVLTGNFPWELASLADCYYLEFSDWHRRGIKKLWPPSRPSLKRLPQQWRRFSPRLMQLFRRMLDPKPRQRCPVKDVAKYIEFDWLLTPGQVAALYTTNSTSDKEQNEMEPTNCRRANVGRTSDVAPETSSGADPASFGALVTDEIKTDANVRSERTEE